MTQLREYTPVFTESKPFKGSIVSALAVVMILRWSAFAVGAPPSGLLPVKPPSELGMDAQRLDRIDAAVQQAIDEQKLPGCVVVVGRRGAIAYARAFGNRRIQPTQEKMTLDTVFDLASLTKPVATATSVMILVERGIVKLSEPVGTYLPEFAANGKESITIEQLLTHQGGLVPDNPLADYEHGIEKAWQNIWELQPTDALGKRFVYTDVGFIVLAEVVHRLTGQEVSEFAAENVFKPLGMSETGYLPNEALRNRAATTEQRGQQWLKGEVHDPRAALLGGVAGHAGLFSTAADLSLYANMLLSRGTVGQATVLGSATVAEMRRPRNIDGQLRGLGWDVRSKYSSNRGELFSSQAFGHGGFTGTAMWIDPKLDLFVIFLSNRVHPDGKGSVNPLAGRIGNIAAAAIQGIRTNTTESEAASNSTPESSPVLTGIDVLERDGFQALAGRRVGLITNHTGMSREGKRTVDLLHEAENMKLVAIFSPEHGLQGKLDTEQISHTVDESTGLPVYSLYGESRHPLPEQLEGIDTLVFDIQDIGARFYTYVSTMGLAMETAAKYGLRLVVLDRPNPIGGSIVEGPLLDSGKESFVGFHTIPVRHGMTTGELARMFEKERNWKLDLQIVELEGWKRAEYWDRTELTWINPSPNMRSLTQALLYPGVGLLETTNLSVGRGTDTPFEVVGAPWIEERALAKALNQAKLSGVRFVPVEFTPDASKYAGERCGGVNIIVVNRREFRSVPVGLEIAFALRKAYPEAWDYSRFNRLLANDQVFNAIKQGNQSVKDEDFLQEHAQQFQLRRQPFLLYR